jgi:hypothetical protein
LFNAVTQQIESAVTEMSSSALLGAGIACAFAGLIIWLAGLGMVRIAVAAVGGFAGFFTGYVFFTNNLGPLAFAAFIGVVIGLGIEVLLSYSLGYATFGYNLIISLLTAASGSVLLMLGMIFLLSLKGSQPLNHVNANQKLYLTLLFAMIVFGTLEQLIFCAKKISLDDRKRRSAPATKTAPGKESSWRNR